MFLARRIHTIHVDCRLYRSFLLMVIPTLYLSLRMEVCAQLQLVQDDGRLTGHQCKYSGGFLPLRPSSPLAHRCRCFFTYCTPFYD